MTCTVQLSVFPHASVCYNLCMPTCVHIFMALWAFAVCELECVPSASLLCEQQASWHRSEDGLAYQATGTTRHVSWQLPLSRGVGYRKDMGIISWTKCKKMRVEPRGPARCTMLWFKWYRMSVFVIVIYLGWIYPRFSFSFIKKTKTGNIQSRMLPVFKQFTSIIMKIFNLIPRGVDDTLGCSSWTDTTWKYTVLVSWIQRWTEPFKVTY